MTLTKEQYDSDLRRVKELTDNDGIKKEARDYQLLKKYDIVRIKIDGEVMEKLKKRGTDQRFVTVTELFGVAHDAHDVTKGHINVYLDFCETCNLKKSKIRKSVVVKPIISKNFNSRAQVIFKCTVGWAP